MSKIIFEDRSFIECNKVDDKIVLTISAKDGKDPLKKIVNACELTVEEFKKMISDIL